MVEEWKQGEIERSELGDRAIAEFFAQNQLDRFRMVVLLGLIAERDPWIGTIAWFCRGTS